MSLRIFNPFWKFWKLPYEIYPDPEVDSTISIRLSKHCCSVFYNSSKETNTVVSSIISSSDYSHFVRELTTIVQRDTTIYEILKILLLLSSLFFLCIGVFNGIYYKVLESILSAGFGIILLLFNRCAGYCYLYLLSKTEKRLNARKIAEISTRLISPGPQIFVGEKCFWIAIVGINTLLSVVPQA